MRQRRVGDVEHALHVQGHHLVPVANRGVQGWSQEHDPGIADHGVQPAQFGDGRLDRARGLLLAGHVRLHYQRRPAV
jgi:hypothetical protein